jgi:trk system potassium uptake protein TrkA
MTSEDHVLIAGGGRVGRRIAERFTDRGIAVTVIERNPHGLDDADWEFDVVIGDATRPSVLEDAMTPDTTTVAGLTDDEDTNLAVCLIANRLADVRTVARIEDEYGDEYDDYVDEVYFPERASIKAGVNALSGSNVRTLADVTGDLEILDLQVDYESPLKGRPLSEIDLPDGAHVISRTNGHVAAQADEKLVAGRRYLVAADNPVVDEVIDQFQGSEGGD